MKSDIIFSYFPDLTDQQKQQFLLLGEAYADWNEKINVVSRKDVDLLYERHVLHSLGIAKIKSFERGTSVLDVGTGGGFPGIPLAILFPHVKFTLVDSIRKKILVVTDVVETLGLKNVTPLVRRAEEIEEKFDYVVSRAVMKTEPLMRLMRKQMLPGCRLFLLKGGDLKDELKGIKKSSLHPLKDIFKEEFFETKFVVEISVR